MYTLKVRSISGTEHVFTYYDREWLRRAQVLPCWRPTKGRRSLMETRTETRVSYIFNDDGNLKGSHPMAFIFHDYYSGESDPDAAANYSWLMDNCIAWVETRIVTEFFIGETRVVVETPWVAEEEGEVNLPWFATELRTLALQGQAELYRVKPSSTEANMVIGKTLKLSEEENREFNIFRRNRYDFFTSEWIGPDPEPTT